MEKISIIVPVYNTERYLQKCIDSILQQTYKNLELILIDDGSTDNSQYICRQAAKQDARVKVLTQTNNGQGSARNYGLRNASGTYIGFVDSDDFINPKMYEKMIKKLEEENADIVICQVNRISESGEITPTVINRNEHSLVETGYQAIERYLKKGRWSAWDKVYRKQHVEAVSFMEGKTTGEDHAVLIPFLYQARKIVTIEDYLYTYLLRENSTTTSEFTLKSFDAIDVWEHVEEQARNLLSSEKLQKLAKARLYSSYIDLTNFYIVTNTDQYRDEIQKLIYNMRCKKIQAVMNTELMIRYKVVFFMITVNFSIYKKLYLQIRRN